MQKYLIMKSTIIAIGITLMVSACTQKRTESVETKTAVEPPVPALAITTIVRWRNNSAYDYKITCKEQTKDFTVKADGGMVEGGNFETNVPWVITPSDFSFGHVIVIEAKGSPHSGWNVWQRSEGDGDKVRASPTVAIPGPQINGVADVNGRRYLIINMDGSITMTLEQ